ncbi:MAG: phosphodiester glycosidase family protein [Gorillibacterium sp.]|nr:phosphodiester glycosidase family protein [Gorillibacterium sp.]
MIMKTNGTAKKKSFSEKRVSSKIKGRLLLLLAMALVVGPGGMAHAAAGVTYESKSISYDGKSYSLQYTVIDPKNPYLRVMAVTAQEGIGHVEDFSSMVKRNNAVAAVNGTFFNAYEASETVRYPNGLLLNAGETLHSGKNQSLILPVSKTPDIRMIQLKVQITIKGKDTSYTCNPWGVNRYYGEKTTTQIVVFTRAFGKQITFAGSKAIINNEGIITAITAGTAAIPNGGEVLFIGNDESNKRNIMTKLSVGDHVTIEHTVLDTDSGVLSTTEDYEAAVGVGPKLVTNGKVDVNTERDGFQDPKITTSAAARSFVGVNANGHLVLGVSTAATMNQLAQVLIKLGLKEAMNLDGGASSALYAEGEMKRSAGRKLSNAIVVRGYDKPQVQVFVNRKIVNEIRGYMENNRTMVPLRGIFERLGATMSWDKSGKILTVRKGETKLVLELGSKQAELNGKIIALETPPVVQEGRTFVPLRFAVTALGGTVTWDNALYRASIVAP